MIQGPLPRRRFLQVIGGGMAGATLATVPQPGSTALASTALTADWTDLPAQRGAFHLHGSHSEGPASVGAHVAELDRTGFDFAFMTDHDWRKRAIGAFTDVPMDREVVTNAAGGSWSWMPRDVGLASQRLASLVPVDADPVLGDQTTVTRLLVVAEGEDEVGQLLFADTGANRDANRVNLTGQQITLTMYPRRIGYMACLLLRLTISYHPASGGRPAGQYTLDYRFGMQDGYALGGTHHGVVHRMVERSVWQTVTVDPVADIAVLWPDLVAGDNALYDLSLGVLASGTRKAVGDFAHLSFSFNAHDGGHSTTAVADNIAAQVTSQGSTLSMYVGEEVSLGGFHFNQFGARMPVPVYPDGLDHLGNQPTPQQMRAIIDDQVRPAGNLVSLNHVYGASNGSPLPPAEQRAATHAVATELVANDLYSADIVEFGYNLRGNVDLAEHLHLMEIVLRNGYIVTANGVSDDHGARQGTIDQINNPMATTLWSPSTSLDDLLEAASEGRGFVSNIGRFDGLIDLQIDDFSTGAVVVDDRVERPLAKTLHVRGVGLRDGYIEVIQGPVDAVLPGDPAVLDPGASVIATIDSMLLSTGTATVEVDVSTSTYVYLRAYTVTTKGAVFLTAFTNPIWWLAHDPIPSGRVMARRTVTYP